MAKKADSSFINASSIAYTRLLNEELHESNL